MTISSSSVPPRTPALAKSPAELLFGRKFRTKLPDLRPNPAKSRADILAARAADTEAKARMKMYKDNKATVQPTAIRQGDRVLLKQKATKLNSVYDQSPVLSPEPGDHRLRQRGTA